MKPRDDRAKVLISARMRVDGHWTDVCVVNISRRGLGAQAATPPASGAFVEVRRGSQIVIARVVWTKKHRFGLRAQDPIAVDALIQGSGSVAHVSTPFIERRASPRPRRPQTAEASRTIGRMLEFGVAVVAFASVSLLLFEVVNQSLSSPFDQVRAALY